MDLINAGKAEHIKKSKALFLWGGGGRRSIIRGFSLLARVLKSNFREKRGMGVLEDERCSFVRVVWCPVFTSYDNVIIYERKLTSGKLKLACLITTWKGDRIILYDIVRCITDLILMQRRITAETHKKYQITLVKKLKSDGIRGSFVTIHLTILGTSYRRLAGNLKTKTQNWYYTSFKFFSYPTDAQLDCSKRMSKFRLKFTSKCSYMFRFNNHHQGATTRAFLKL